MFLNIRREQREVHELRDPRSRDAESSCYLRTVTNHTSVDGLLDLVGERKHGRDSGRAAHGLGRWLYRTFDERCPVAAPRAVELAFEEVDKG